MSIRYTLRHNIPSANLAEEDVNDSSTWDLNLLRKHELAETDNHDIVYRTHDGEVVNWADAATQQANEILEEVQGISTDIDNQVTVVENRLAEIEEEAVTLTQEAQEANEAAQEALVQAGLAVTESQESAESANNSSIRASEWAVKTDGLVDNNDYSSKYYAQQSGASASSASSSASTATSAKDNAQTSATNASNSATLAQQWATKTDGKVDSTDYSAKHYALSCVDSATSASQSATDAASSASTATTKASQASSSASTATTKANEASASATSASNSANTATTKASEASASATSASTSATNASASATSASNSATSAQTSADLAEQAREDIQAYYGLPVGFEFFSMNPNVPDGTLPLLGGEYSRVTYSDLWNWVQQQTGYLKTEAEWQDLSTTHNGNVPYYSDGDGSTTFRVPSLKCWVKGANGTVTEVGSYLAAGLPNITGQVQTYTMASNGGLLYNEVKNGTGALSSSGKVTQSLGASFASFSPTKSFDSAINLNASRSSSIYGNSTTVQPESIVGMWLVKAYGVVVDTGQIDEQQYIDDRIAALPTSLATSFLPLSGGAMGGSILSEYAYKSTTDAGMFRAFSGTDSTSSFFTMYGKNAPSYAGYFHLSCKNGSYTSDLIGSPNGSLTWGGNNIITSALTGNVLSAYGTSSTMSSDVELCSITNHAAGLWLLIGHVDLNFAMNDAKAYNNVIASQSHGSRNVRSTGYNGGGSVNVWLLSLNANEKISLRGYCPASSGSGSMRGTLQMVRLA